jgi:phosphoribosylanthranilate isomerase
MLKTKVKASAVANLTDARYFAAWGVEWLGFQLDPGAEGHLAPQVMLAIREWVDGVQIVGEFGMQPFSEIRESVPILGLDAVQVGMYAPLTPAEAAALGVPLIREIVPEQPGELDGIAAYIAAHSEATDIFLLDFDKNRIAWSALGQEAREQLQALSRQCHLLLGISASPAEIEDILQQICPYGLSLRGGQEEKVGFKSFDQLDELFEALEE